jgi:dihydropyrimidinase/allantoinase
MLQLSSGSMRGSNSEESVLASLGTRVSWCTDTTRIGYLKICQEGFKYLQHISKSIFGCYADRKYHIRTLIHSQNRIYGSEGEFVLDGHAFIAPLIVGNQIFIARQIIPHQAFGQWGIWYQTNVKQSDPGCSFIYHQEASTESNGGCRMHKEMELLGGQVYVDGQLVSANVYIVNGKIVSIGNENECHSDQCRSLDCTGMWILPGTIDTHVHIREPGSEQRETFLSGTMAAAAGGVTTVCEHPISNPPPFNPEILKNRHQLAEKQIVVDCCFYGALGSESIDNMAIMKNQGIIAFKTFLQEPMKGREKEFEGLTINDDFTLLTAMEQGAKHDVLMCFHAENDSMILGITSALIQKGRTDPKAHYESHPIVSETESVSKLLTLARHTGAKIEICHVSSAEALDMLKKAKAEGIQVIVETCPHYMFATEEDILDLGPMAKCNPPIRSKKGFERLWGFVNDGTVDMVGSDHAPFTIEEKTRGFTDIFKAPAGFPGIETRIPLMIDAVLTGRLTLSRFVSLVSENPARVFRIDHRKGTIGIGKDADFIVLNPGGTTVIDKQKMYTKGRDVAELYNGRTLQGSLRNTIVRGQIIMDQGIVSEAFAGFGQIIKPDIEEVGK